MAALDIVQIPVLNDNFIYLLHEADSGETAAVDPALDEPVLQALEERGWGLTHILITHHHGDHTGGNEALKRATGCTIVGAGNDAGRIPGIDVRVRDGDSVRVGDRSARVFEVPGHTSGHVAYWFERDRALFSGDTLFSLGCGRLFEGSAEDMWRSLGKLRDLPDDTRVYCAHEYTDANADFALSIEPGNEDLIRRAEQVTRLRERGEATVPSSLAEEKRANPFLRADNEALQAAAGLAGLDAVSAFAEIRRRKDSF